VDASETDISKGGNAETLEYTLLKFDLEDGRKLVAATLRPETVFGLTNFWVNPEVEYVDVQIGGETWVVSRQAAVKLEFQKDEVHVKGSANGSELIGKKCKAPYTGKMLPIFPSSLCDPNVGSGLVMSVPSDAPVDWIGLVELRRNRTTMERYGITVEMLDSANPVSIIDTPGWGPLPAVEITDKMGIGSLSDPKLEEATKEIYKSGFHRGVMNAATGPFAGQPVDQAKDAIREEMLANGQADLFYDLSEEVLCRCGQKVFIKKIPDQWFIDYANPGLTAKSKEHALSMEIFPREYHENIQNVLEWYRERACVRLGNWLGTLFPFDQRWKVEAIADSTLYPVYYAISMFANTGQIKAEGMNEEFFDYVLLGKGDAGSVAKSTGFDMNVIETIKEEFEFWYPLDVNLGGKEHMTVHFPVFLMNHVAILQPEHWPKGIIVNWYITGTGGKMSKSKGGAQPIPDAAERFGVDAMRLFYSHIASLYVDVAWEDEKVESYRDRLLRLSSLFDDVFAAGGTSEVSSVDGWLRARMQTRLARLHEYMSEYDLRSYSNSVYFEMPQDFRWYLRRGGNNKETITNALSVWVPLLAPVTPHIAEELWQRLGMNPFASTVQISPGTVTEGVLLEESRERLLEKLIEDVAEILKVTEIKPKRIVVMAAPAWKHQMLREALTQPKGKLDISTMIKKQMATADPAARKEIPTYAKELAGEVARLSEADRVNMGAQIEEVKALEGARAFLESEFGCEVQVFSADDPTRVDPKGKARFAKPGRPAVYLES
jgi:leucyl-tRNA synthetase